jgi:hypothetical protein
MKKMLPQLRPKKVHISPGIILNPDDVPHSQWFWSGANRRSIELTQLSFNLQPACMLSQLARFCASAGAALRKGLRCTIACSIWKAIRA